MNGTVPNIALKYDKKERVYPIDYEEAEITEEIRASWTIVKKVDTKKEKNMRTES